MSDRTFEFRKELARINSLPKGVMLSETELAGLMADASLAHGANRFDWHRLEISLGERTDWQDKKIKAEMRRARLMADLKIDAAEMPYAIEDAIPLWMASRGYTMTYVGIFKQGSIERSLQYVLNRLTMWCKEMRLGEAEGVSMALYTWMEDQKLEMLKAAFDTVRHNPAADPTKSELRKLVQMLVPKTATYERDLIVGETVLENWLHRIKNHLGAMCGLKVTRPNKSGQIVEQERWTHGSHIMPVFYGSQGIGKSLTIAKLLEPLEQFATDADFGVVGEDNSTSYQLSIMPILVFEEMAGISKGDTESLKAVMTQTTRMMRQAYERAGPRKVVTTFIAATNKHVNDVIKDTTGNRRFYEYECGTIDLDALSKIDALKLWRSINEDLVAPVWRDPEIKAALTEAQAEQRAISSVEAWLRECDSIPYGVTYGASKLMEVSFSDWLKTANKADERAWNFKTFGQELFRLSEVGGYGVHAYTPKDVNKGRKFRIEAMSIDPAREKVIKMMDYREAKGVSGEPVTGDDDGGS